MFVGFAFLMVAYIYIYIYISLLTLALCAVLENISFRKIVFTLRLCARQERQRKVLADERSSPFDATEASHTRPMQVASRTVFKNKNANARCRVWRLQWLLMCVSEERHRNTTNTSPEALQTVTFLVSHENVLYTIRHIFFFSFLTGNSTSSTWGSGSPSFIQNKTNNISLGRATGQSPTTPPLTTIRHLT